MTYGRNGCNVRDMEVTQTPEAPIMLRADITRAELADLKVLAIKAGLTTQQLLALIIRERLEAA